MSGEIGFRLSRTLGTAEDLARVKLWCKTNRVPFGRLMNHIIKSLTILESYSYKELTNGLTLGVQMPPQIDIDNQDDYRKRKASVRYDS